MSVSDSLAGYSVLSAYYPALIAGRDHAVHQYAAVLEPILNGLPTGSKVIDAACGNGEVLAEIAASHPDKGLIGSDGSSGMLITALADPRLRGVPVTCCRWDELDALFSRAGLVDLVFILGNAIAHVPTQKDLLGVLCTIRSGLRNDGWLVLDSRKWAEDRSSKELVEEGRPGGVERDLGAFEIDGENVRIYDRCEYRNGRQVIRYRSEHQGSGEVVLCEVSYLPFEAEALREWMTTAGFATCESQDLRPGYPYIVTSGRAR